MRGIHTRGFKFLWLMGLTALLGTLVAHAQTKLINYSDTWKFQVNSNAANGYTPADAWTAKAFNDTAWLSGQGLFGYEGTANLYDAYGLFKTFITPPGGVTGALFPGQAGSPNGPTGPGGPSAYFRKHVTWAGPATSAVLTFTNAADDWFIVYVNGTEVWNFGMADTPRPMTWDVNTAAAGVGANPLGEAVPIVTNIVANLAIGDNVIAVELHQPGRHHRDYFRGKF